MAHIPEETKTIVVLDEGDEAYLEQLGLTSRVKDGKILCSTRQEALLLLVEFDEASGQYKNLSAQKTE